MRVVVRCGRALSHRRLHLLVVFFFLLLLLRVSFLLSLLFAVSLIFAPVALVKRKHSSGPFNDGLRIILLFL